jgi:hypothetical protein
MSNSPRNGTPQGLSQNGTAKDIDFSQSTRNGLAHLSAKSVPAYPRQDAASFLGSSAALHSLRRRWPQMICAGVLCAATLSIGSWLYFQPRFTTYAALRVHSETPRLAFDMNEVEQAAQFEVYKRTQKELVLGDDVLLAALRKQSLRVRIRLNN